jgi:hypothetical protein
VNTIHASRRARTPLQKQQLRQSSRTRTQSQRYLGEVSDVRFFNFITQRVLEHGNSSPGGEALDSYEQDDSMPPTPIRDVSVDMPPREIAESYFDVYFSTIHIAYPFVSRPVITGVYEQVKREGVSEDMDVSTFGVLRKFPLHAAPDIRGLIT